MWLWLREGPGLLTRQKALAFPSHVPLRPHQLPRHPFQATTTNDPDAAADPGGPDVCAPLGRRDGGRSRHPVWQRASHGRGPGSSLRALLTAQALGGWAGRVVLYSL